MCMIDENLIRLVCFLYKAQDEIMIKDLELFLCLSGKTIRKIINENQETAEQYGFQIVQTNSSVSLRITDGERFTQMKPLIRFFEDPKNTNLRMCFVIKHLLDADDYIRIEDLADELYVSRATLDRLIPEIKTMLQEYDLRIVSKPKYGIRIEGKEINKRAVYKQNNLDGISDANTELYHAVQIILEKVIRKYNLILADDSFNNLIHHCAVAVQRIHNGNMIDASAGIPIADDYALQRQASEELCSIFEEYFDIEVSEYEKDYITLHLLGKQILSERKQISEDTIAMMYEVYDEIHRVKGIDFRNDNELTTALLLHLQPMIIRSRTSLLQKNPMLTDIKRNMPEAYEIALLAAGFLKDNYALALSEDEAGYMALHFAIALDRLQNSEEFGKIAVVCGSGRGTAKLLKYRLVNRCHLNPDYILLTSVRELEHTDFSEIQCILTTVPLLEEYPVPVLVIDLSVSKASQERLSEFLDRNKQKSKWVDPDLVFSDMDIANKEDAIHFLCKKIEEKYNYEGLYEQVIKREALSSTEIGSMVAMPHPFQYPCEKTAVAFMTLKSPVMWKYQKVKLIILMVLSDTADSSDFTGHLSELCEDAGKFNGLVSHLDAEALCEIF